MSGLLSDVKPMLFHLSASVARHLRQFAPMAWSTRALLLRHADLPPYLPALTHLGMYTWLDCSSLYVAIMLSRM
jgi:hypothetical protein